MKLLDYDEYVTVILDNGEEVTLLRDTLDIATIRMHTLLVKRLINQPDLSNTELLSVLDSMNSTEIQHMIAQYPTFVSEREARIRAMPHDFSGMSNEQLWQSLDIHPLIAYDEVDGYTFVSDFIRDPSDVIVGTVADVLFSREYSSLEYPTYINTIDGTVIDAKQPEDSWHMFYTRADRKIFAWFDTHDYYERKTRLTLSRHTVFRIVDRTDMLRAIFPQYDQYSAVDCPVDVLSSTAKKVTDRLRSQLKDRLFKDLKDLNLSGYPFEAVLNQDDAHIYRTVLETIASNPQCSYETLQLLALYVPRSVLDNPIFVMYRNTYGFKQFRAVEITSLLGASYLSDGMYFQTFIAFLEQHSQNGKPITFAIMHADRTKTMYQYDADTNTFHIQTSATQARQNEA